MPLPCVCVCVCVCVLGQDVEGEVISGKGNRDCRGERIWWLCVCVGQGYGWRRHFQERKKKMRRRKSLGHWGTEEGLYSWHEGRVVGNECLNLGLWDYAQEFGFYSECGTEVMRGYIIFCFRTMSVFPSRLWISCRWHHAFSTSLVPSPPPCHLLLCMWWVLVKVQCLVE